MSAPPGRILIRTLGLVSKRLKWHFRLVALDLASMAARFSRGSAMRIGRRCRERLALVGDGPQSGARYSRCVAELNEIRYVREPQA